MKKILSSALVALMLFASVVGLIPVKVDAATTGSIAAADKTVTEIKAIVEATYKYKFETAQEMLDYEISKGYIDQVSSKGGDYTIFVNRYTGTVYYKNNLTGQMLTSNPYETGIYTSLETQRALMNQITIKYSHDNGEAPANNGELTSAKDAAERGQVSTTLIPNGIRVNYTIGDTTTRFIVPMQITGDDFVEYILNPIISYYEELIEEHLVEEFDLVDTDYKFYSVDKWKKAEIYDEYGYLDLNAAVRYAEVTEALYLKKNIDADVKTLLVDVNLAIKNLRNYFTFQYPEKYEDGDYPENIPVLADGTAVYICNLNNETKLRKLEKNLAKYAGYNVTILNKHEEACEYEHEAMEHPVFRCSIEYSFNSDGSLSVRLPVNSISFDEEVYNLESITPLQFFGAGDLNTDGYVFIPDGAGSVIEYEDFYVENNKQNVYMKLSVYGDDFAYANPSGKHKELITLPVYGVTTENERGGVMYNEGYFAILEEGASLATMYVAFGGSSHKYSDVYASYSPYPSDQYVLNASTGGSNATYTIVSDSKYTGSYVTRYVMLGDETDPTTYNASYVGMATYYRDYLKANGMLKSLENIEDNLPLYIEALGSMSIVEKFLTFPVTVSKPLTTFADIVTMYKELSDVTTKFESKAKEYRDKSALEVDNKTLREKYLARAEEYDVLVDTMKSITNVNFKLTGFANGGMYYTYPSKVAWENACGGSAGFTGLINSAKEINAVDGSHFGVFPEFDFSYMSNSAWFDGISEGTDLSRMVDNRYASKQVYNSVLGIYESFYSMVISTDALDRLYTQFNKSYSAFGHKALSLSTLGSDLNSNFDSENPINRDDSSSNVVALLDRIANTDGYEVMISVGNSYTLGYADHILDIATDSSHFTYSSYTVPFIGMVLHSYVNYAGSPLNYSGSPDYEILRAIESGASLYYILCYDNTEFMKEDEILNDYYGIDYQNWYDNLVRQYNKLNNATAQYQSFEIVNHEIILAERVIDSKESAANAELIKNEFLALVRREIENAINDAFNALGSANVGAGVKITINAETLVAQAEDVLNIADLDATTDNGVADTFYEKLLEIKAEYESAYSSSTSALGEVSVSTLADYKSEYDFVTDSTAYDDDYDYTDYTADNKRVAVVTYKNAETGEIAQFILNYNVFTVKVDLGDGNPVEIPKYGFHKI